MNFINKPYASINRQFQFINIILLILLTLLSCNNDSIPFSTEIGMPILDVNINGKDAKLLLDTGASISIIDSSAVSEYDFNIYDKTNLNVSGIGGTIKLYYTDNTYTMSGVHTLDIDFKASNLTELRRNLGVVGVLGSDYLKENKLIIDFTNNTLRKASILD